MTQAGLDMHVSYMQLLLCRNKADQSHIRHASNLIASNSSPPVTQCNILNNSTKPPFPDNQGINPGVIDSYALIVVCMIHDINHYPCDKLNKVSSIVLSSLCVIFELIWYGFLCGKICIIM